MSSDRKQWFGKISRTGSLAGSSSVLIQGSKIFQCCTFSEPAQNMASALLSFSMMPCRHKGTLGTWEAQLGCEPPVISPYTVDIIHRQRAERLHFYQDISHWVGSCLSLSHLKIIPGEGNNKLPFCNLLAHLKTKLGLNLSEWCLNPDKFVPSRNFYSSFLSAAAYKPVGDLSLV